MTEVQAGDRRARRHAATRDEILSAAWALADQRGLTGWTLRELAAAVDMRAPSLYGYFVSKEAIYDAMFAQGYRELLAIVEALPDDGDPVARLHAAARTYLDFCVTEPARFQLLFLRVVPGFTPSPTSYALALETVERLRAALAAVGVGDPATVDLWTATLTGLASQQLSNDPGGDRWTSLVDQAVDRLLRPAKPG